MEESQKMVDSPETGSHMERKLRALGCSHGACLTSAVFVGHDQHNEPLFSPGFGLMSKVPVPLFSHLLSKMASG